MHLGVGLQGGEGQAGGACHSRSDDVLLGSTQEPHTSASPVCLGVSTCRSLVYPRGLCIRLGFGLEPAYLQRQGKETAAESSEELMTTLFKKGVSFEKVADFLEQEKKKTTCSACGFSAVCWSLALKGKMLHCREAFRVPFRPLS